MLQAPIWNGFLYIFKFCQFISLGSEDQDIESTSGNYVECDIRGVIFSLWKFPLGTCRGNVLITLDYFLAF